jgi:RNA polymerase sigma factor for flagellar operon FliA
VSVRIAECREFSEYLPLVHKMVGWVIRRVPANVLKADLVSAGSCGLLDAMRRSPTRGPSFECYAKMRIRGAIFDELRSEGWFRRRHSRPRLGDSFAMASLDEILDTRGDSFVDDYSVQPDVLIDERNERVALEHAVAALPERESYILSQYYFGDVQFKEIAAKFGVSTPRISQLHRRAIGMIRQNCSDRRLWSSL